MGSGLIRPVPEAEFIYLGLVKEKWKHLTPETIQGYLDDPSQLDDEDLFADDFHKYHEMYWSRNKS